ncbi:hypothetical protein Syun_014130 [Stephania yunnanensis]|uniref:TOD1/MUCI70 glycosyltransferase-like domain-containing protein n=1 Tax=Stephania yunnanensis TaxID=152371 RepID=A0AAP0PBI1_9MAGN
MRSEIRELMGQIRDMHAQNRLPLSWIRQIDTHTTWPNSFKWARVTLLWYSIWLDSKLRLQKDPLLILEYFLWRKGYEYAISNHYDRHCLWEEVAQNKKLNKFNHTIIDQQFSFYQADGMKRFNALDPNKLLPSSMNWLSSVVLYQFLL